ncbi:dephospho-CoA kinase [Nitrosospira briensis]|uniref:dephospho-CoA kinase n=1 Tax=Nitrosospira briensis TaxID=35799 RepID=UPI0008E579AC|nr:dephospho-CoA kinase [Nitrosospira briensis]SFO37011.1 dephospho-CoA kinase [Nitrosospira briensis]
MPLMIGLTGGIGSGKTTAANFFSDLGVDIIDTDVISHELTEPQGGAIAAIREVFTSKFITAEGALKRKEMRGLIFSDSNARQKLEAILHPLIRVEVSHRVELVSSVYGIVVVPLLLETGQYRDLIERVLVVDCSEHDQIARAIARPGLGEQTVRAIMAIQYSREERLQKADDVILNTSDMAHLERQISVLHRKYTALASRS